MDCTDSIGRTPLHHAGNSSSTKSDVPFTHHPKHILETLPSNQYSVAHRDVAPYGIGAGSYTACNCDYFLQLSVAVCPALRSCGTLMPIWMSRTG